MSQARRLVIRVSSPLPMRSAPFLAATLTVLALMVSQAQAQGRFDDEVELEDILQVVVLPRQLLAINAREGGQTEVSLTIGEQLLWELAKGQIAVAVTDQRILAVSTASAAWQERRIRRTEKPPGGAVVGARIALLATRTRAIGFEGSTGNFLESELATREVVVRSEVGEKVGVIITNRRALGVSTAKGGFFEVKLRPGEGVQSVRALADLVTIAMPQRILIFRGPSGSWEERSLDIR